MKQQQLVGVLTAPGVVAVPCAVRRRNWYAELGKPAFDAICAVALGLLLLPLIAALALAVRTRLGSPVIYRQARVGRDGRVFTVYKFRSMAPDRRAAQQPHGGLDRRVDHKSPHDPRLGSFGRTLRTYSLDELPQLWNVLSGDMSLVGPRPELPELVRRYDPWQHRRHAVRPGMTGLWQVSRRGSAPMHLCTASDLEYVARLSVRTDIGILLRTLPAALGRCKGA